jgi:hypothetical protein
MVGRHTLRQSMRRVWNSHRQSTSTKGRVRWLILLMATVSEFKVGGFFLALRADSTLGLKPASNRLYLDQILGLTSDTPPQLYVHQALKLDSCAFSLPIALRAVG